MVEAKDRPVLSLDALWKTGRCFCWSSKGYFKGRCSPRSWGGGLGPVEAWIFFRVCSNFFFPPDFLGFPGTSEPPNGPLGVPRLWRGVSLP